MFSLCPHLEGGGQISQPGGGGGVRSKVNPARRGVRSKVNPAGGVRSSWRGGQVKGQSSQEGQVQPGGGGQVQLAGGGVSILRPLAGGMPLAFTQEDFLVSYLVS